MSRNFGMQMEGPLVCCSTGMHEFLGVTRIHQLLSRVTYEASQKSGGKLQIIVCVMGRKHDGYKYLKYVSETETGVVAQCLLSTNANVGNNQYLANLCLKINAKVGGGNVELIEKLTWFEGKDHIMFVGADVNHLSSKDKTSPSVAAVVAMVNWPAANCYIAQLCPRNHCREKIENIGTMSLELINAYAKLNGLRPKKIVVFRVGVSDTQFDMVMREELVDFQMVIFGDHIGPTIALIVAQKRHQTRHFIEDESIAGLSGNVPPGTVVDTTVVHPLEFDFYLCSHYGGLGTSKPTPYYVLYDEHKFTSDKLQKLVYNMCFTSARCLTCVTYSTIVLR